MNRPLDLAQGRCAGKGAASRLRKHYCGSAIPAASAWREMRLSFPVRPGAMALKSSIASFSIETKLPQVESVALNASRPGRSFVNKRPRKRCLGDARALFLISLIGHVSEGRAPNIEAPARPVQGSEFAPFRAGASGASTVIRADRPFASRAPAHGRMSGPLPTSVARRANMEEGHVPGSCSQSYR
jgi:hypothetical protein